MIDRETLYKSLRENYYCNIPIDLPRAQIDDAMNSFVRFLELPMDVKSKIDFAISKVHRRGDVGYKHRDPKDDIYNDSKDFFHYHEDIIEKYADFIESNPIIADFVSKAQPIWEKVYKITQEIMRIFDKDYPGTYDKVFTGGTPHIILRFLKYNWQKSGKYLAKPHFDAGSFTIAIAESCEGLRIGSGPDDMKLVEHIENNSMFFVSSNYKKIIDSDVLTPAWHDVIQMDKTQLGKSFARWAMVCFIDGIDVEALSREENHKFYKEEMHSAS